MATLEAGDPAPNFDLTSTEDVVLMLRDEVPRSAVVLYLFADPADERARADLAALGARLDALRRRSAGVLAISPAKLPELKAVQRELGLEFPLLTDDRGLSKAYGVEAAAEGEAPAPALVLVDRDQRIAWIANPVASVEEALGEVEPAVERLGSPISNYPGQVTNRLVGWWVNR